jgi:hypothetical protein
MDYSAFWNIVPNVSLFMLTLGMTAFVVMDFARARVAVAQPIAIHVTAPTQEQALAA